MTAAHRRSRLVITRRGAILRDIIYLAIIVAACVPIGLYLGSSL